MFNAFKFFLLANESKSKPWGLKSLGSEGPKDPRAVGRAKGPMGRGPGLAGPKRA